VSTTGDARAARRRAYRRGLAWDLIKLHFRSRQAFTKVHKTYEATVAGLVQARGKPREEIKLNPDDTRGLFDTDQLRDLILRWVEPLRETAQGLFRGSNVAEPYDMKVSRIYHELSILFEEHLSVQNFPRDGSSREFTRLFREVSEYYPQRLRRVRDLFSRAQRRLEEMLPEFEDDPIVLRSAYLFREELWHDNPQAGLNRFLEKMFPKGGAAAGYLKLAQSFFRAAFHAEAIECAKVGVATLSRQVQARSGPAQSLRDTISELDSLIARAGQAQAELTEQDR
jgi:hypothetical protein